MSSNSSENPTAGGPSRKELLREENKLVEGFLRVLQNKVDQISMRDDDKFRMEEAERNMLLKINNMGLLEGVLAGAFSFFVLRRTRASFTRRYQQMRDAAVHQQQQQQHHPSGPVPPPPPQVRNSPFQNPNIPPSMLDQQQHPGSSPSSTRSFLTFNNIFGLFLDGIVSFSVAASVSFMLMDTRQALQNFAQVPLLPGRSRVAEEFCPEIIAEWDRLVRAAQLQERSHNNYNGTTKKKITAAVAAGVDNDDEEALILPIIPPESPYLAAIVEFRHNCVRRQAFERKLRKEQGLSDDAVVSIPEPGVPVLLDEEKSYSSLDSGTGESGVEPWERESGLFYEPSEQEQKWADDFTTDQEEDKRR